MFYLGVYSYSRYGTSFDVHEKYSYPNGRSCKKIITLGANMSSPMRFGNKKHI